MRRFLISLASSTSPTSLAAFFRKRRFKHFRELIAGIDEQPITILDIGGWQEFWEVMGFAETPHQVILLNRYAVTTRHQSISSVVGDARDLRAFADNSIDVVFSNSVIEHLGTFEDQRRMASEVRRVGRRYFIQTPSFFFPLEPHFLFPFFHWLPIRFRIFLIRKFSLGFVAKKPSREDALRTVSEYRLLTKSEMKILFPEATILLEKIVGFTKSYIAIKK
ncbi:MAG: class I SAM-dependent methyltransferase [Acidobacteria bacterium]|jgi:hypothetical protein|nr:class I SAM-dependent methyltransferase [Acidobacteriota bacterium]